MHGSDNRFPVSAIRDHPAAPSGREDPQDGVLQLLGNQIPARISATDRELRVLRELGCGFASAGSFTGRTIPEIFAHSPDLLRVLEASRKALSGDSSKLDVTLGESVAQLQLEPFRDPAGNVIGVLGAALDITERARTENALRKSERLLVEAQALGHTGSWEYDLITGEISGSEENRRLFFGDDRTKGSRFEDYSAIVHPADHTRFLHGNEDLIVRGIPREVEYRIVWADGSVRTIRGRAQVVRDETGRPVRAIGTNADVTERKRAEEELNCRVRQQVAVAQLGLTASRGGDLQALFDQAMAVVAGTFEVDYCMLMEAVHEGTVLVMRAGAGPWKDGAVGHATVPAESGFMASYSMRSAEPVVVDDLRSETRFVPCGLLLEHGIVSGVSVPIPGRIHPLGVLGAHMKSKRAYTPDDLCFLSAVANLLGTSMERSRVERELREKREELQALSRRLLEAQEMERRAVARELHDDFGQVLTAIKLNLMRKDRDPAENIALVDHAIATMRELARDLRPSILDDLGLSAALRWYVAREAPRAGLEFNLDLVDVETRLPAAVETTCFRVVQEALTNAMRHSQARRFDVTLDVSEGAVQLTITDDGKGFDVVAARRQAVRGESQGLLGMQERVALLDGHFQIDSAPGRGTSIRASFPLATGAP